MISTALTSTLGKRIVRGLQTKDICRRRGISDATYSNWKSKHLAQVFDQRGKVAYRRSSGITSGVIQGLRGLTFANCKLP